MEIVVDGDEHKESFSSREFEQAIRWQFDKLQE